MSTFNRRNWLTHSASGLGSIALLSMLAEDGFSRVGSEDLDPLAPKATHHSPRAKRVIFLYMTGGVSHVDSFDPKPQLFAKHGKQITVDNWQGRLGQFARYLKKPNWEFRPGGRSGIEVSDLFPHIREVVDQLCIVRSMETNHTNHYESTLGMHCGSWTFARPSLGAWVSYGLGTVNRNLPSFVVLAPQAPYAGAQTWGSDFLPGCHQGTQFLPGNDPVPNLTRQVANDELQKMELDLLADENRVHQKSYTSDSALEARIRSFETAFGMQREAPEALDLTQETAATLEMYGLKPGQTSGFGWQCLVARRLAERGVRFIELIDVGSSNNWDAHGDMATHAPLAKNVDQPIAALIRDLQARGMLEDTLVVWTTEFGRTPYHETAGHAGREHHHQVFSSWLAGGGIKPGMVWGSSDEFGIGVAENRVHVHDLHATILHLLGLDHQRLTFRHAGRDYRLTDVEGNVIQGILA